MEFTARFDLKHMGDGDRTGLSMFDKNQSYVAISQTRGTRNILFSQNSNDVVGPALGSTTVEIRVVVRDQTANYFYSTDSGITFQSLGKPVGLVFSWWKAARPALFAFTNDVEMQRASYIDVDWAHYRSLGPEDRSNSTPK
jgi:hypothetical protein